MIHKIFNEPGRPARPSLAAWTAAAAAWGSPQPRPTGPAGPASSPKDPVELHDICIYIQCHRNLLFVNATRRKIKSINETTFPFSQFQRSERKNRSPLVPKN